MAQPIAFHFRSGTHFLHRMDPRFKLIFLALISLSTLNSGPMGLAIPTLILTVLSVNIRLPVSTMLFELRYFTILLLFVFIARCLTVPGDPIFTFAGIRVTHQGVVVGAVVCWRLALIVLMGLLLSVSTRPKEIRTATEHLFAPIPLVPEKRIATMLGLIVRFIPVILTLTRETADAQRARAVEQRRNPIYRLSRLAFPVMRRTVDGAERLAIAMEARCFDENRPTPPLKAGRADWVSLLVVIGLCAISILY
jgi:biotin transport system permease protein